VKPHRNGSRRKLEVREVRRHRRNIAGTKENRERGRERWFEKDNALESEMIQDCYFSLQPIKRYESCPLYRGGFQE